MVVLYSGELTLEKIEGTIKNGKSIETGNTALDTGRRQQNKTYNAERLKDEQYTDPTNTRDEPRC
jgi:hypothetical protein